MNMAGGHGGGAGASPLTTTAGGGGAASGLCFGNRTQCTEVTQYCPNLSSSTIPGCMVAVGGGGGGAGGGTSVVILKAVRVESTGGMGGQQTNLSVNGANGQGLSASTKVSQAVSRLGGIGGLGGTAAAAYVDSTSGGQGQQPAPSSRGGSGGGGGGGFNGHGGGEQSGQPGSNGASGKSDVASGGGGGGQGQGTTQASSYFWQTGSCSFSTGTYSGNGTVTLQWYGGSYCSGHPVMIINGIIQQVAPIP